VQPNEPIQKQPCGPATQAAQDLTTWPLRPNILM